MIVCQKGRKAPKQGTAPWPVNCLPSCEPTGPLTATQAEVSEGLGFDQGANPWRPVYWRTLWDETSGAFGETEYSETADFGLTYTPLGNVVPSWQVNERVFLGFETVLIDDVFSPPATANVGEYTAWPTNRRSAVMWTTNGNGPAEGAAHITHYGGFFQLETKSSLENLQAAILGSGGGTIYAEYFYDPNKTNI